MYFIVQINHCSKQKALSLLNHVHQQIEWLGGTFAQRFFFFPSDLMLASRPHHDIHNWWQHGVI